ncbi:hypothetical protein B9479_006406 [Cryptococcus floricola]|uniref:Uncharacterized protein n=1 Tax=Cryptococcus floricola TaxID=2591691 RepID=A0A5D3AQ85_9TREE|nr:hypothetical protein B9479_006406 [Cryptococcus floricola]
MSSPSRVAHTTDILHVIFSHISDGKDLTSLLRTSPLFFERAPRQPVDDHWANWDKLPSLPAVETVIIHPADRNARKQGGPDWTLPDNALIEWLCPTATRLHISTPCVTPGATVGDPMPDLPDVETLVVKANAGEIEELHHVVGKLYFCWNDGHVERPDCSNIKAVHILLWGDLVYPEAKLQSSDWGKDCVDELAITELTLETNAKLKSNLFYDLCEIAERLGTRDNLRLSLYNADTVLERLSKWTKCRKVDDMKTWVERAFGEVFGMPEEGAECQVFWQTGLEFYEAFGDVSARDETEEWYHSAVLTPSPNLVSLRARLAAKTKFAADTFVGLTEREAERTLANLSSN